MMRRGVRYLLQAWLVLSAVNDEWWLVCCIARFAAIVRRRRVPRYDLLNSCDGERLCERLWGFHSIDEGRKDVTQA